MATKRVRVRALFLIMAVLVGCAPTVATTVPTQQPPSTASQTQTATSTFTATPTATQTLTPTTEPSMTQPFIVLSSETVRPVRTRTTNRPHTPTVTPTLSTTLEPTVTATGSASPTATFCPFATPEPLWVEPVTSPTDQLTQIITVRIGNGEEVSIVAESGTFTVTGNFNAYANPAEVEAILLPNTEHHLQVSARIRTISVGGCTYGGYTLTTATDRFGDPLTIVQQSTIP